MPTDTHQPHIYDGEGDTLMQSAHATDRIIVLPDTATRDVSDTPRIRIPWGQNLLEDVIAGRYRSLVCSVNAEDNGRGIIGQIARLLPTSQWSGDSITRYARQFVQEDKLVVIKYDLDMVELLALLRPRDQEHLTLDNLKSGFQIVSDMITRRSERMPSASVSFLGANANKLRDTDGNEPSFETVLRIMYDAGYAGDVYPAPWMWESAPTGVYARYPFHESLSSMREGGF